MRWIKFIPVIVCLAQGTQEIVQKIEEAKEDDGRIDADEVLGIIETGVEKVVGCLKGVFTSGN